MSESTNYQPVMAGSGAKEGATATAASSGRPGLWTRITDRFPFLQHKRGVALVVIAILVIIGGGLAGLAALHNRSGSSSGSGGSGNGSGNNPNAIQSDTHFYGQSPAVEPSRKCLSSMNGCYRRPLRKMFVPLTCHLCLANITGLGSWGNSLSRAQAMVSNMTLDEKVGIVPHLTYSHTYSRLFLCADQLDSRHNE